MTDQTPPQQRAPDVRTIDLPFRATTTQACRWLARQTGTAWSLARLIEHGLRPSVWLDYDDSAAAPFGKANGGYAAALRFEGDLPPLPADGGEVTITIAQGSHQIVTTLRFLRRDLERVAAKLLRRAASGPVAAAGGAS